MGLLSKNCFANLYLYNRFGWICFACVSCELRLSEVRTVKDFGVSVHFRKRCEGESVCQSKLTPTYDGLMIKISRFQAPYANQRERLSKFSLSQFYCGALNRIKDKKCQSYLLIVCVCGIQLAE